MNLSKLTLQELFAHRADVEKAIIAYQKAQRVKVFRVDVVGHDIHKRFINHSNAKAEILALLEEDWAEQESIEIKEMYVNQQDLKYCEDFNNQ